MQALTRRALLGLAVPLGLAPGAALYGYDKDLFASYARVARVAATSAVMVADYSVVLRWHAHDEDAMAAAHARNAKRLRDLCFSNKGVYIKIGQHLSVLDFVLPAPYPHVLSECFDAAPQSTLADVGVVFAQDFDGRGVGDLFASFDPVPIASASLAQVHRATGHDGRALAVKVQHRHLRHTARTEVAAVRQIVRVVKRLRPEFALDWLADEVAHNLPLELDFRVEARNSDQCRDMTRCFGDRVVVPRVHHAQSSSRVLVMDFEEGVPLTDRKRVAATGLPTREIARLLSEVFGEMIFVHGRVHCDPHPGNLLVRPSPHAASTPQLIVLDHGLYRDVSEHVRLNYCRLWKGIVLADVDEIRSASEALGVRSERVREHFNGDDLSYRLVTAMLTARTWDEIANRGGSLSRFDKHSGLHPKNASGKVQQFLGAILEVLENLPRPVLLLLKTNDCLRSVSRGLGATSVETYLVTANACIHALSQQSLAHLGFWERTRRRLDLWRARLLCHVLLWTHRVTTLLRPPTNEAEPALASAPQ